MADHYSALGVPRNASKEEIKEAFRKLAVQFHPDKHAQSPDSVRDAATRKFKQISEAYDVLVDDRKRDAYNFSNGGTSHSRRGGYSNYYDYCGGSYYKASSRASRSFSHADRRASNFDALLQFIATRTSIRNLAFASMIIGGAVAFNMSGEKLWKMHNPGKSFEEAMECIERTKASKDEQ